jgi:serine protease
MPGYCDTAHRSLHTVVLMGVNGRVALTLVTLGMAIAGGTATAAGDAVPTDPAGTGRAVILVSTPELPTGGGSRARSRWHELRLRSRAILDRIAVRNGLRVDTSIPEIGLLSVDLGAGGLPALRRRLAGEERIRAIRPDVPVQLRLSPNDFAFNTPDIHAPNGDVGQWNLLRENGPGGWDLSKGAGAEVAVVDSGTHGAHPDLAPRIVGSAAYGTNSPLTDPVGHGTHTAGLACAQTNNGYGIASLGFDCGLFIAKIPVPGECSNVAAAVTAAANRGSDVISMSLGGCDPAIVSALNYAQGRGSILVAAGDNSVNANGDCPPGGILTPDNCLYPAEWAQPSGTGPNASFDRGLVVTSAKYDGTRSDFAEATSRVSVAAHGSASGAIGGQQGILSTWPAGSVEDDDFGGRTTLNGDNRFAYLVGTSMATPQVAGVAALIRAVKPNMPNTQVVHLIKATASHCGSYANGIGWGIVRADEAVAAALGKDIDPPSSHVRKAKRQKRRGASATRSRMRPVKIRLKSADARQARCVKSLPISGVAKLIVFASRNGGPYHRIGKTRTHSLRFRPKRKGRYSFYSIAVDKDGNREAPPPSPDVQRKL